MVNNPVSLPFALAALWLRTAIDRRCCVAGHSGNRAVQSLARQVAIGARSQFPVACGHMPGTGFHAASSAPTNDVDRSQSTHNLRGSVLLREHPFLEKTA